MAGFKVGFIMFRIIHRSSSFPGCIKYDWAMRPPKKVDIEYWEDGKKIIEWEDEKVLGRV